MKAGKVSVSCVTRCRIEHVACAVCFLWPWFWPQAQVAVRRKVPRRRLRRRINSLPHSAMALQAAAARRSLRSIDPAARAARDSLSKAGSHRITVPSSIRLRSPVVPAKYGKPLANAAPRRPVGHVRTSTLGPSPPTKLVPRPLTVQPSPVLKSIAPMSVTHVIGAPWATAAKAPAKIRFVRTIWIREWTTRRAISKMAWRVSTASAPLRQARVRPALTGIVLTASAAVEPFRVLQKWPLGLTARMHPASMGPIAGTTSAPQSCRLGPNAHEQAISPVYRVAALCSSTMARPVPQVLIRQLGVPPHAPALRASDLGGPRPRFWDLLLTDWALAIQHRTS